MKFIPRALVSVVLVFAMFIPVAPAISAQQASPSVDQASPVAARSLAEVLVEQRENAVPLGESAIIGNLTITVNAYDKNALDLLNPDYTSPPHENETVTNIEISITNSGSSNYDINENHVMFVVGNRGMLRWASPDPCTVGNNLRDVETARLEPDEERVFNVCGIVSTADVESLQFWISAPIDSVPSSDRYSTGTWFDLGGSEAFDPAVSKSNLEQSGQATFEEASVDNPASPETPVAAGDLVYEVVEYNPRATGAVNAVLPSDVVLSPEHTLVTATIRIVNVGDRLLGSDVMLFDSSGVAARTHPVPVALEAEFGALLPGGSMERTSIWIVRESELPTLVFRLSHSGGSPAVAWMLAEASNQIAWDTVGVSPARPASEDQDMPVAFGDTASVHDLNISIASGPDASTNVINMTPASGDVNGSRYVVTLDRDGEPCSFIDGSKQSGVFARFALPGALLEVPFECESAEDPGTVRLTVAGSDSIEFSGYFETITQDPATPIAPIFATPTEVEPTPTEEPDEFDASSIGTPAGTPEDATTSIDNDETATVIESANVRSSPSLSGEIVTVAAVGEIVTITGDGVQADGYTWLPILTSNGTSGWVAAELIED